MPRYEPKIQRSTLRLRASAGDVDRKAMAGHIRDGLNEATSKITARWTCLPALIRTPGLRLASICETRVQATVRKSPGRRGLALLIARELARAGIAIVPALQAVWIIASGCGSSSKKKTYTVREHNLAHFILSDGVLKSSGTKLQTPSRCLLIPNRFEREAFLLTK